LNKVMKIKYYTNLIMAILILESLLIISNLFIKTDPTKPIHQKSRRAAVGLLLLLQALPM
jgi:hypothetical protein